MLTKDGFAKRLKTAIEQKQIKQAELAEMTGVTPANMSNYMRGKVFPPIDTLAKIAEKLEVSIDWIVYGEEQQKSCVKSRCDYVIDLLKALDKLGLEIIQDKGRNDFGNIETSYFVILQNESYSFYKLIDAVYKLKDARPHLEDEDYESIIMKKVKRIAKESHDFETENEEYNRINGITE